MSGNRSTYGTDAQLRMERRYTNYDAAEQAGWRSYETRMIVGGEEGLNERAAGLCLHPTQDIVVGAVPDTPGHRWLLEDPEDVAATLGMRVLNRQERDEYVARESAFTLTTKPTTWLMDSSHVRRASRRARQTTVTRDVR